MTFVRRFLIVGAFLLLPVTGYAQEATLTGTVTDSTGAVLPGVTVSALNEATGNTGHREFPLNWSRCLSVSVFRGGERRVIHRVPSDTSS